MYTRLSGLLGKILFGYSKMQLQLPRKVRIDGMRRRRAAAKQSTHFNTSQVWGCQGPFRSRHRQAGSSGVTHLELRIWPGSSAWLTCLSQIHCLWSIYNPFSRPSLSFTAEDGFSDFQASACLHRAKSSSSAQREIKHRSAKLLQNPQVGFHFRLSLDHPLNPRQMVHQLRIQPYPPTFSSRIIQF